jgi:DNA sulfur modification protein DndD
MPYVNHLGVIETYSTASESVADDIELGGVSYPYIRSADLDYSALKVIK